MAEEPQVTGVEPESGVGPEPAQPEGPSTEAAGVAAAPAATQATEPTEDALAKFQERLSRQQAILDRNAAAARKEAEDQKRRADALQDQIDQQAMSRMTEAERVKFQADKQRGALTAREQELAEREAALKELEARSAWQAWFIGEGVSREKLNECRDFGEMQLAYREHLAQQVEAAK